MKRNSLLIFLGLCLCLIVSCKTPETITVTEYVPIEIDIEPSVKIVENTRPVMEIPLITDVDEDPTTLLAKNLVIASEFAFDWQDYAFRLEDLLDEIKELLKKEAST